MVLPVKTGVSPLLHPVANRRWMGGDGSVVRKIDDQTSSLLFRRRADAILCRERGDPGTGHNAVRPANAAEKILPNSVTTHDLRCRGEEHLKPTSRIYLDPVATLFISNQKHSYASTPPAEPACAFVKYTN